MISQVQHDRTTEWYAKIHQTDFYLFYHKSDEANWQVLRDVHGEMSMGQESNGANWFYFWFHLPFVLRTRSGSVADFLPGFR